MSNTDPAIISYGKWADLKDAVVLALLRHGLKVEVFADKAELHVYSVSPLHWIWTETHRVDPSHISYVYDRVYIAFGTNPEKAVAAPMAILLSPEALEIKLRQRFGDRIIVRAFQGLMVDHIATLTHTEWHPSAVIRGLRNGDDLQYEMVQQYWNEDLGLSVPTVFFITDRRLAHISSSSIRAVAKARATTEHLKR